LACCHVPPVSLSATGHSLQLFRISSSLHRNLRGGDIDLTEILRRQLDSNGSDVLLQAMQLPGAGDGDNPGLLRQKPGECRLSGGRLLPLRDSGQEVDHGLIRLPSLRRESRDDVAEVRAVERCVLVDLPREEALAQGAEGDESYPELLEGRQDLR